MLQDAQQGAHPASAPPLPSLQLKLPATGARLVVASDGLWDAMPAGRVARVLRGQPTPKAAANQAVASVAASLGGLLRDDITGGALTGAGQRAGHAE